MIKIKLITFLVGVTLPTYWKLVSKMPGSVEILYLPRALLVLVLSITNSVFSSCEKIKSFNRRIVADKKPSPIFILGHWGSGTTFLHKLICSDNQFTFPTLLQVSYPSNFWCTQRIMLTFFKHFFPKQRHWDGSKVNPLMPMEDELALAILTLRSPYLGWVFPQQEGYYDRYLTFSEVAESEVNEWKKALIDFVNKVTWNDTRMIVLKSPPHTARIKTLLSCYPNARFIHVHRHPLEVYQATLRLYEKALPYFCMQSRNSSGLHESILARYDQMYRAFYDDIKLLSNDQICHVRFDKLQESPLPTLGKIYHSLSLSGFAEAQPRFEEYIRSVNDYQEPTQIPISPEKRLQIKNRWSRYYRAWDYSI